MGRVKFLGEWGKGRAEWKIVRYGESSEMDGGEWDRRKRDLELKSDNFLKTMN